ncbi:shikimate dehydrogenase family protein [Myroides odoratus]|uniref:Shikimate dehydrogenase n=1 Tax=Myroides odoratus TaxID=256 RepID=A0A378RN20_MYROD|nr:shikimate dehydrogenase [Myroides odoratus]QQU05413.1 shikimate dehydrogenase [Myroides odoratus]STZ27070.1 Shikimate dehydrogenase [Myroides odoratus]
MIKKQYGLIGKDIAYSFSQEYFTEKFKQLQLTDSQYSNFDLAKISEFSDILERFDNLKGLNVTIPYKQAIIPYLDSLSKKAAAIGAVNTIRITRKNKLKGYNTDWYGFYHSLKPLLKKQHTHALILGTGGASKAIEYALAKLGIAYKFASRTKQDTEFTYEELTQAILMQYTVIINTTPLGTFPDVEAKPNIPYQYLTNQHLVYDLIYNPAQTTFLHLAAEQQATTKNGHEMLVLQAEKAYKIWSKRFEQD